jgi:LruC domain-containing protein
VPEEFDWKTIENNAVTLTSVSTIVDQEGDTLAAFVPPGEYNIITGKTSSLTIIEEQPEASPLLSSAISTPGAGRGVVKEILYFPAKDKYATMMFEDLFPSKGDMDMNDVVFGVNIEYHLDNQARIRSLQINIQPRAIGSSYEIIGLAASLSSTTEGTAIVEQIEHSRDPHLTPLFSNIETFKDYYYPEPGNTFDVIPLTGDFRKYFNNERDLFLNVRNIDDITETLDFGVFIELKSNEIFPASELTFLEEPLEGMINLDIFTVIDKRAKEVHFKGGRPTVYFNYSYFGATYKQDFSTPDNWVWAVLSDKSIRHPLEFRKIYHAYPNFKKPTTGTLPKCPTVYIQKAIMII